MILVRTKNHRNETQQPMIPRWDTKNDGITFSDPHLLNESEYYRKISKSN